MMDINIKTKVKVLVTCRRRNAVPPSHHEQRALFHSKHHHHSMMCQTSLVVSVATEVEASCEALWAIISNIEIAPAIITPVVSVERISEGNDFCVGTRWKEIRKYQGEDVVQLKTVTSIRREAGGVSVAINVSYLEATFREFTNTSTLEMRPSSGRMDKSLLIGSFGVMPGNLISRILFCLRGRNMARIGAKLYLEELEDIGKAAVRHMDSQKQPVG